MKVHVAVEYEGDADRTITMKGIEVARERKSATAVADDTDILVMLVHMWDQTMGDLFLRHEARKSIKKNFGNNQHKECRIQSTKSCERKSAVYPCMGWL